MNEQANDNPLDDLPESVIQPRSKISIVWIVPIVAVLIGVWVAYKAWSEMGPTITITFKTADGLEAGKTKIKYKNVEVGEVKTIRINHETGNVDVTAELHKESAPYLTDQTRFWVVRARVAASGVSGLETLLSGAYIGYEPNSEGKKARHFTGLEIPPVIPSSTPGKHFILHAQDLGSIERDVPVYYRKFNVGLVEDVKLNEDGKSVTIRIFVRSPFDQWVNKTTKFWNASGIDLSLNANGVKMNTESLVSILIGGIAFESTVSSDEFTPAENYSEFKLFANKEAIQEKNYKIGTKYVLNFSESVRGLTIGAPVEFRGIQIGEVTDIKLSFDTEKKKITIPVTIVIDLGRMALKGNVQTAEQLLDTRIQRTNYFVKEGMRAQLKTGNLLTGQLYIDADFFPDAMPYKIDWSKNPPEFPTEPTELGEITHNIKEILKKVDDTMTQAKALSYKLNHSVVPELSATLKQTEKSLAGIENMLKNDSPLQQDLQTALREVSKAARSVRTLADYLERHPEALIEGKKGP